MRTRKNLYLVTDGFPFGKGEKPFLLPELPYFAEEYEVTIISPAPKDVAADVKYITPLDSRIKLVHVPYPPPSSLLDQNAINGLSQHPIVQEEIRLIISEGDRVQQRINFAFNYFIMAEMFYRQVLSTGALDFDSPGIIYNYWNTFRCLAFCIHRDEYPNLKLISRYHNYDLYNERDHFNRQPYKTFMNQKLDGQFFVSQRALDYYLKHFWRNLDVSKSHYALLGVQGGGGGLHCKDILGSISSIC